jgi:hypothetical protein
MEIKAGKIEPVPQVGDILLTIDGSLDIKACNCNNGKGDPRCGPHFVDLKERCFIYWHIDSGWSAFVNGAVLVLGNRSQSQIILKQMDLKTANSNPSATNCVKCGSKLKEPYPGLKHCPKCEP